MEDCQFPTPNIVPSVQIKWQNNVVGSFDIRGIVHYEFVPTEQSTKFTIWKYRKGCVKNIEPT